MCARATCSVWKPLLKGRAWNPRTALAVLGPYECVYRQGGERVCLRKLLTVGTKCRPC